MSEKVPKRTVDALARSVYREATGYGFDRVSILRLINALMDLAAGEPSGERVKSEKGRITTLDHPSLFVDSYPLRSKNLLIRKANPETDRGLVETWLDGRYGRHFVLSCATAQQADAGRLLTHSGNRIGIITLRDRTPIGAIAFFDVDPMQRRAELRKLIGVPEFRGLGYAEEATTLWLRYGFEQLNLEKVYVSTLQNHLRNVQLNESVGFRVEGVLAGEVVIDGVRHDVLRMGFLRPDFLDAPRKG